MTPPDYAELHCISNFTFLRGASHPDELVARAKELGYQALAITDECSMSGVVRAHIAAKEHGLKLIIGSELHLADGTRLVVLAMDANGYGNLCELISLGRRRAEKGTYRLGREDFASGLPGCLVLIVPGNETDSATAGWVRETFPSRSWCAVELLLGAGDRKRLAALKNLGLPLVAAGDVHMHVRERRMVQDTVTAIRLGKPIFDVKAKLYPNAERHLRSRERLARLYPPELLAETAKIAERCTFSLDDIQYEYPQELVPPNHTPTTWLRVLTEQGIKTRWPAGVPDKARSQIERELALIAELGYEPFFLTVYDVVRFARSQDILCQGRGSAANSAVCFCLGITELDPARMNLLFERFVSKERQEPPDIDVDFEHQRREEVIQYIYTTYGRNRAAITATLITYQPRSAVRDVAKALGLGEAQADRLASVYEWWDPEEIDRSRIRKAGLDPNGQLMQLLAELVTALLGFPRHLSQHVGGFVISHGPLSRLVPIENAAMENRTVIQWDKDDLDALGLLKVDVLALGALTALHRMQKTANKLRNTNYTLATLPAEDPEVYAMLQKGDSVGTFQVESRAQMVVLPIIKPREFEDLIVCIGIIRPGPIVGGMRNRYIARRRGLQAFDYPSDGVKEILGWTYGVPIFQEQIMQLAMLAGFTGGEADQLRRGMGAWRRTGDLGVMGPKLIIGLRGKGYPEPWVQEIADQMKGFGEYGFPMSHSAMFALIAYGTAWYKCHEPAVFLCEILNSLPMGFYEPAQLCYDARRHGVEIRDPDINQSGWDCTIEPSGKWQPAVRLGLRRVSGLSEEVGQRIAAARPYKDVATLARAAGLDRYDFRCLASAGALESLAGNRHQSYWAAMGVEQPWALGDAPLLEPQPLLAKPTEGQDIVADYASIGLTLKRHPLAVLREQLNQRRVVRAESLAGATDEMHVRVAGLVTHRQRPGSAKGATFLTLEDETGLVNIIVWKDLGERQRKHMLKAQLLAVTGQVQRDGDVVQVLAKNLEDYTPLLGQLHIESRDFR